MDERYNRILSPAEIEFEKLTESGGYYREISTAQIRLEDLSEVVNVLRKYFEQKHLCVISDEVIEGLEFKVKGDAETKYGRVGIKIMGLNKKPGITYSRFQQTRPESPLGLIYHINIKIGYVKATKNLIDRRVKRICKLHPLLKEQKRDNVIIY